MLLISQKIPRPEKLNELAACLELTSNFNTILQDPTKSELAGFNILYEWVKHKGGTRDELVETLRDIDLPQLAVILGKTIFFL